MAGAATLFSDNAATTTSVSWCHQQQQQPVYGGGFADIVVKQEQASGFLDAWSQQEQQQQEQQQQELDRYSPEERKKYESRLIKEELSCQIQLKMMKEGRDCQFEEGQKSNDHPISEETKQLQKIRREKNREAAKKCRQKKKVTEKDLEKQVRDSQLEIEKMQQRLAQAQGEYASELNNLPSWNCFIAYLKANRHLLSNPILKSALQKYAKARGIKSASHGHQCSVCPMQVTECDVEQ